MIVKIVRSGHYVRDLNLASGHNNSHVIEHDFDPADLPESVRSLILDTHGGAYPQEAHYIAKVIGGYTRRYPFEADITEDEFTVQAAIVAILMAQMRMLNNELEVTVKETEDRVKREQKEANRERIIDEILTDESYRIVVPLTEIKDSPRYRQVLDVMKQRRETRERDERNKRESYLKNWVENRCTVTQREMMDEGVLDMDLVIKWMTDNLFTGVNLPAYADIHPSYLANEIAPPVDVESKMDDWHDDHAGPLTESVFVALGKARNQILSVVPGAQLTLRQHAYYWEDQDYPELRQWSLKAEVIRDGIELSREFALPDAADWIAHSCDATPTNPDGL